MHMLSTKFLYLFLLPEINIGGGGGGWGATSTSSKFDLFLLLCFKDMYAVFANSVDPDLTPLPVASDRGLRCFPILFLGSPD